MNIPIDDRFRLSSDELSWRIEQQRKNGEWRPVEYHTTIQAAVNSLSQRMLRTVDAQTLADALVQVERVTTTLTRALAPHYKVEAA